MRTKIMTLAEAIDRDETEPCKLYIAGRWVIGTRWDGEARYAHVIFDAGPYQGGTRGQPEDIDVQTLVKVVYEEEQDGRI
jgi:hypothetical protein